MFLTNGSKSKKKINESHNNVTKENVRFSVPKITQKDLKKKLKKGKNLKKHLKLGLRLGTICYFMQRTLLVYLIASF